MLAQYAPSRKGYNMFKSLSFRSLIMLSASAALMTGCAIAPGYTDSEKEIKQSLSGDNFRPAAREMRDNIETQELFAQAAFWSREYELNPGDLESAIKLSAAVRKLGNPQRAVEIAQTTRALYPRDPYLAAEFAAALIASEQAYEAMEPLDTALRSAPGYARLWSLKGAALDQQEEYDLARKHYSRAMQITPNDPNIMANIGLSFALSGDPQTAEGWLRRAVSVPGASKSVRQNLSLILQLQGKEAEAAKYSAMPQLRGTTTVGKPAPQKQAERQTRRRTQPSYKTSSQAMTKSRANSYAPRNYTQSAASGIPASERGGSYAQGSYPRTTMRPSVTANTSPSSRLAGASTARKTTPLTASDAARMAAQKSTREKMTVPLGQDINTQTSAQSSVLSQIAKTIGPQASNPLPTRAPTSAPQAGYGAPTPYAAQANVRPQAYPRAQYENKYPQGRTAARARR